MFVLERREYMPFYLEFIIKYTVIQPFVLTNTNLSYASVNFVECCIHVKISIGNELYESTNFIVS